MNFEDPIDRKHATLYNKLKIKGGDL